jgi:hypothetical protein
VQLSPPACLIKQSQVTSQAHTGCGITILWVLQHISGREIETDNIYLLTPSLAVSTLKKEREKKKKKRRGYL